MAEPSHLSSVQKTAALEIVRRALKMLRRDARANPESSSGNDLLEIAHLSCEAVAYWTEEHPEVARQAMQPRSSWPFLLGRHPAILEDTIAQLTKLGLGETHPLAALVAPRPGKRAPKGCNLNVPANRFAGMIFEGLVGARRDYEDMKRLCATDPTLHLAQWCHAAAQLPPLRPGTIAESWFKVGWQGVVESDLLATFTEEVDGHMRPLGHYRGLRRQLTRDPLEGSKTQATNVRDGTKTKIKQSFIRMVPHVRE